MKNGITDLQRADLKRKLNNGEALSTHDQAVLLIVETEAALEKGTKHYDRLGNRLTTVAEVLTTLGRDGEITFEPLVV